MDIFGLVNIPDWILVFIVILLACHWYLTRNNGVLESLGIPYSKPLPLFGSFLQDLTRVMHENDVKNSNKYGRIYGFYEFNRPTIRVTDPTIIKEVLVKQFNNFTDRREVDIRKLDSVTKKLVVFLRGEEWKKTRNVMTPTFTSGKLKQMVTLVNKCCERFVDILAQKADKGESLDAKDIYISYLLDVVGTCAFGIEMKSDNKSFAENAKSIVQTRIITIILFALVPKRLSAALGIAGQKQFNYIKDMLKTVIEARKSGKERRNDFLQLMLDAVSKANSEIPNDGNDDCDNNDKQDIKSVLTPDGILAQCLIFLFAGFETTSTALSYITYTAATNQECQGKLIEEIDQVLSKNNNEITWDTIAQMTYMDMFISETLRMYPPAIRFDRRCLQDTKIGNLRIPKNFIVNIAVYALHHDEQFYPDPYKFDPERFSPENKEKRNPYTYLPFGAGPRNCIGMRFAMMKLKITLIHILKDFRFRPTSEVQKPLVYKKGCVQILAVGGIHVKLIKRLLPEKKRNQI